MFLLEILLFCVLLNFQINISEASTEPEEIHHAICNIATEEIQASANATIVRELKGVCSADEMNKKIDDLEEIFKYEMNSLNELLVTILNTMTDKHTSPSIFKNVGQEYDITSNEINKNRHFDAFVEYNQEETNHPTFLMKTLPENSDVTRENGTIKKMVLGNVFTYFWRTDQLNKLFGNKVDVVRSPVFSLGQYDLEMQILISKLKSGLLSFELEGFPLKRHRFSIIDELNTKNTITSPMLFSLSPVRSYEVSQNKIRDMMLEDTLLIKLIVYLDLKA